MSARLAALLACFFLSGFAALLYQTVWTRAFAFVFGTSELAVATVLAAYMGGLAAGAAVAARFVHRIRRPVLVYGLLELGIAVSAVCVPALLQLATAVFLAQFGNQPAPPDAGGALQALYYLGVSFAILAVPTGLMGATLPLLARHAVRDEREIGPRIGLLYAMNTVGAIAGTLAAGFWILPALGQWRTLLAGACVNAAVFVVATVLARVAEPVASAPGTGRERDVGGSWILLAIALSGMVSFADEVLFTRLLGHLLGGSVYAFSTMLASFLAGIALGSAVAARLATSRNGAIRGFAVAQLAAGFFTLVAFVALDAVPSVAVAIGAGWQGGLLPNAAMAGLVLLPATLCIGATFPFAVRILARDAADASAASAKVYAWNTGGAIAGALGAGFLLIPAAGYAGTVTIAVLANLALAGLAALRTRPRATIVLGAAATGAALLAWTPPPDPWRLLRASPFDPTPVEGDIRYFAVGRGATVLLYRRPGDPGTWHLRTNGLPEASIGAPGSRAGRYPVNGWLGSLSTLARPDARSLVVVGLGGGLAVERVPSSIRSIDVIELEPEVLEANRAIAAERGRDPLADPRVRIHLNDARSALLRTDVRFDALVSQPSHPWTAGASHLYTREFFALVRDRLAPDGVFVQWIGLSFVDENLLRSLVATLADVFPYVEVYRPEPGALLFLASAQPLVLEESSATAIARDPADFASLGLRSARDVLRARVLDSPGVLRFSAGAPVITDDHNLFETLPPAHLRAHALRAGGATPVLSPFDPLLREADRTVRLADIRRLAAAGLADRAARLASGLEAPADRQAAAGYLEQAAGREDRAAALFGEALRQDPDHAAARFAMLRLRRRALAAGDERLLALEARLSGGQRAVLEGLRREAAGDLRGVAALEAILATVDPEDAAYPDALHLRAAGRLALGDAARAREGLALLDEALSLEPLRPYGLLRARLAAEAGYDLAALSQAGELAASLPRLPPLRAQETAAGVASFLDAYDLPAKHAEDAEWIRERLGSARR